MKSYITLIILLSSLLVQAQEQMTLPRAISIGLENNLGIKIADKYIQIAENNDTWARAGRTPTIDLGGSFTNNLTDDNNPASFLRGTFYNGSLGANASVNYVAYAGGRIKVVKEQLELATSREKLNQESAIHDLIRDIYQQYYNVIFQQERSTVLQQSFDLSKERLQYEEVKRQYGSSNSFNLLQFENATLTDSTNLISQVQLIKVAKRQLYNTLDLTEVSDFVYLEKLSVTDEVIEREQLAQILSEENYTLKSLSMIASLNQLNTKLAKAARKPTVALNGQVGLARNAFKFFADDPDTGEPFPLVYASRLTAGLGAQVSYNAYDGGVRSTNEQNALIQEDIDRISYEQAIANLNDQLDILVSNYQNQQQILSLTSQQLQLSTQNYEIATERFKGGLITSIDLRNIQLQSLNANFSKVNAIYNLVLTKSEIDYLVGQYDR